MESVAVESRVSSDYRPRILDSVDVWYEDDKRLISCFCGQEVVRSIVPHIKGVHPERWEQWVRHFVKLRALGYPSKKIMRLYRAGNGPLLFSWTVVDRAVSNAVESGMIVFTPAPPQVIEAWEPEDFQLADGTIWNFPRRGNWAVHSSDYRGNWPPQLARNLILKYTQADDLIIDAFAGGGTTLIEAWLCGRRSLGIDISKLALQITQSKIEEMKFLSHDDPRVCLMEDLEPLIIEGNSLELEELARNQGISPGTVQLICAHPPYLDLIKFTNNDDRDISIIKDPTKFYNKMRIFALNSYRLLETNGICALLIGDVRKQGKFIPLGISTVDCFQSQGFTLEAVVIKTQNGERSTEFYRKRIGDALLLEHEYLFVLRKIVP